MKTTCCNPNCGKEVGLHNYCNWCSHAIAEPTATHGARGLMIAVREAREGKLESSGDGPTFRESIFDALRKCTVRELLNLAKRMQDTFKCTEGEAFAVIAALDVIVSDKKGFGG